MKKILTLSIAVGFALSLQFNYASASEPRPKKYNVVFIVADDLNTDMGCYGHPLVKTPNLDRLVKRGIRFDRAYCQSPVCNPSRTSFLSGRRPGKRIKGDVVFLPNLFRAQGYVTIEIGKVTHSYGITATAIRWDINKRGKIEHAVALLREKRAKPFFLAIGMTQTHPGYSFSRKNLDLYPPNKLTLLNHPPELLTSLPKVAFNGISVKPKVGEEERRKHIARYFAAITTMDEKIGVLLDALDRHNLWDNTIVIFFSDHGRHLGEFGGVYDKRTLFEASVRVPLIVAAPGVKSGKSCGRLVELVDVYPTLTELCGLPSPKGLEGTSFRPLLKDPDRSWKKAAFSSARIRGTPARSVRTKRFRYVEWPGQEKAALFDHQADPKELRNLFGDRKHAKVVAELRQLLKNRWSANGSSK